MTFRSRAVRIVLVAGGLVLSLVLIAFLIVQIQLILSRWRAERLSADMHQIRLYQSTWGRCSAPYAPLGSVGPLRRQLYGCKLPIRNRHGHHQISKPQCSPPRLGGMVFRARRLNLYEWLGGRDAVFYASFTVHDGTIWRTGSGISVTVPTRRIRRETIGPGLSLSVPALASDFIGQ